MCLFINTNARALVYCTHGSNQLLNKYCFVCGCEQQFSLQGLGGKNTLKARILIKKKRGTCPWNVVEADLGLFFLSFALDEGATKISKLFGFFPRYFLSVMISIQLFAFFRRESERERALLQDSQQSNRASDG